MSPSSTSSCFCVNITSTSVLHINLLATFSINENWNCWCKSPLQIALIWPAVQDNVKWPSANKMCALELFPSYINGNLCELLEQAAGGSIGIGVQSTLGWKDIFARKYMYEKLTKFRNFTWYLAENARILYICPNIPGFYMIFTRKIFSWIFCGEGQITSLPQCPPSPTHMEGMSSFLTLHRRVKVAGDEHRASNHSPTEILWWRHCGAASMVCRAAVGVVLNSAARSTSDTSTCCRSLRATQSNTAGSNNSIIQRTIQQRQQMFTTIQ